MAALIIHPLATWVQPIRPSADFPSTPGIVTRSRNVFCASIPAYQRVHVVWPETGARMEGAAWQFVAVDPPSVDPVVSRWAYA